jgi:GNAT superfamily N-acetyltransferase
VTWVREIETGELAAFVEVSRAAARNADTVEDLVDWKRQAPQTVWLLADDADGRAVGAGRLTPGWHSPPEVSLADVRVAPEARGRGVGSALLAELQRRSEALGRPALEGEVQDDDLPSLAWTARRGFREVGRTERLQLRLADVAAEPVVDPPAGITIVTWAERPELARGIYEVACEAYPDEPGSTEDEVEPFETWLAQDMQGVGDRPEAVFVALADDEVVGYAKLAISSARPGVVLHDMTGVKRAWRGRGIAAALKRAEIAWAKRTGVEVLETVNHEHNAPIRHLNERHGYRRSTGSVTVRRDRG